MMAITRLAVLSVLSKRTEADVDDIEDIVIRKIPVLTGVIAVGSPYEVEEEIDVAINQINVYAKEMLGIEPCVEKKDGKIKVHGSCVDVVKRLYEGSKRYIETVDTLFATYGRLVLPILD